MSSLRTIFRALVMVAAGVIVVKGWQLHGPSSEKVKATAISAIEMAEAAWNNTQQPAASPPVANDPRPQGALIASEQAVSSETAPLFAVTNNAPAAPQLNAAEDPAVATTAPDAGPSTTTGDSATASAGWESGRMPELLARLEEIGGVNPQLGAWGTSGQLYRFSCRARLADSPSFSRHFEAVAEEPLAAVEQVVASVEAWRAEQEHDLAP
jgi:hypothetical protein